MIEVDSYIEKGFVKILPLKTVRQRFCEGKASCLALKIKQKANGSTKRGATISQEEKIILPRAQDIVTSLRVMSHESPRT